MAQRGVAKGKPGAKHAITEAVQGKYHYTYGPFAKPVLTVDPGAVVSCETHDAFEGAIKLATDKPSEKLNFPFLNPQNGPIFVNGAEKGDCLAVHIKSIVPRGPQPVGTTALLPEFGGLVGTTVTALLNKPLTEHVKKIEVTVEGGVKWSDKITLPYEPFIGTIGTAPEIEAISSLVPDYYGGNMDLPGRAGLGHLPPGQHARRAALSGRLPRHPGRRGTVRPRPRTPDRDNGASRSHQRLEDSLAASRNDTST
jgi:hypothetical protein